MKKWVLFLLLITPIFAFKGNTHCHSNISDNDSATFKEIRNTKASYNPKEYIYIIKPE